MIGPEAPLPALAPEDLDWDTLFALAQRHRVTPSLAEGLRRHGIAAPPPQAALIEAQCHAAALDELAQAATVMALCEALDQSGIKAIILKGISLSLQIHSRLGLRVSRDIDLLVTPEDVPAALALLAELDFAPKDGVPADPARLAVLLKRRKDIELQHAAKRQLVELHWRLFDNPRLMAGVGPAQAERVALPMNLDCHVLPDALNLRYLALHGCQHGWSRLKWLADFAALLSRLDPPARAQLYHETGIADGRRALGQAMILCEQLFALPLDPGLRSRILADRRTRWLIGIARQGLIACGTRELEALRFGSTVKNLSHYLISASPAYLLTELRFDLADMSAVPAQSPWRKFGGAGRIAAWAGRRLSSQRR